MSLCLICMIPITKFLNTTRIACVITASASWWYQCLLNRSEEIFFFKNLIDADSPMILYLPFTPGPLVPPKHLCTSYLVIVFSCTLPHKGNTLCHILIEIFLHKSRVIIGIVC